MGLLLQIKDLSFVFSHKVCFMNFSAQVYGNARIALIGDNGAGKSLLLQSIAGLNEPHGGLISVYSGAVLSYIPQTVAEYDSLSGGERFNKVLTAALAASPDILLLDEPTNHLDVSNRNSLMRMLNRFNGAVISATHDTELINSCFDTLWDIRRGKVSVFSGNYGDYMRAVNKERQKARHALSSLNKQKKQAHEDLMKEQKRAKHSRHKGEKNMKNKKYFPMAANAMRDKSERTAGGRKSGIEEKKEEIIRKLEEVYTPLSIKPSFSISHLNVTSGNLVQVVNGAAGYAGKAVIKDINFTLEATGHLAVQGDNGSGKTTLVKALTGAPEIIRGGEWYLPKTELIGCLDQHYGNLDGETTVLESLQRLRPDLRHDVLRKHLNDYLFRKNEEVNTKIKYLSGGEKARLSLAHITMRPPALLILDEITNNIDVTTRNHIIEVLKEYPGAMIVISHGGGFLKQIGITKQLAL